MVLSPLSLVSGLLQCTGPERAESSPVCSTARPRGRARQRTGLTSHHRGRGGSLTRARTDLGKARGPSRTGLRTVARVRPPPATRLLV